jgi:hypothetical protein
MAVAVPTPEEIAAELGVDSTDTRYMRCYDAGVARQAVECVTDPYEADLAEALFRRVANLWASKAMTLGTLNTGTDYGIQYVPRYDPILDNLENPYRRKLTVVS